MKLWVDDIRPAPDESWVVAENIQTAVKLIKLMAPRITEISFDHDISIPVKVKGEWYNRPSPDTFQVVAEFAALLCRTGTKFTTHSSNPAGRKEIVAILEASGHLCEEKPMEKANRVL